MDHLNNATPSGPAHAKHFVFVDEYNRHKRLKVMRACDGCRKRKIKCDGALQNGPWPCGACVRLKLKCVPPSLDADDEQDSDNEPGTYSFHLTPSTFASPSRATASSTSQAGVPTNWIDSAHVSATPSLPLAQTLDSTDAYSSMPYQRSYSQDEFTASSAAPPLHHQGRPHASSDVALALQPQLSSTSNEDPEEVEAAVKELSEQMGDLTVDHLSVAPWIANPQGLAERPAVEEADALLPASVFTDSTVNIPPEMMPSDGRCLDYFDYFFTYIHPYLPVLGRKQFYEQWQTARHTISPLLLEGLFACVARYLEDVVEVRRWLALAARHEESFKDVPRISTIQAMLLLMKAREHVPKRGYYYRSWMSVRYMTTMAKDLGLHEHFGQHRSNDCKLARTDCLVRTRIWHTLFMLELLVGAPQGRTDFSVELETVDLSIPTLSRDIDAFDYQTSRQSCFLAQTGRNIKITNRTWQALRNKRPDWALDPTFIAHNQVLATWLGTLPPDMDFSYNEENLGAADVPIYLGSAHFNAYVHIYHHLTVVMHHRPQLQTLLQQRDPRWRASLDVCLKAAAQVCRLQEALMQTFGLHGLQFMIRGINFSIYCVLSCTMLHLAAITSPDPEMNIKARNYFTRHMRVLEHCTPGASLDVQVSINALREAFSADTTKAFELKPTLGLHSPTMDDHPTPPSMQSNTGPSSITGGPIQSSDAWAHTTAMNAGAGSKPLSASSGYSTGNAHLFDTMGQAQDVYGQAANAYSIPLGAAVASSVVTYPAQHHVQHLPQQQLPPATQSYSLSNDQMQAPPAWDPSMIFDHWNVAFGPPPPPAASSKPAQVSGVQDLRMQPQLLSKQSSSLSPQSTLAAQQQQPQAGSAFLSRGYSSGTGSQPHAPLAQQQQHSSTSPLTPPPSSTRDALQASSTTSGASPLQPHEHDALAAAAATMPTVTPHMWENVFNNAYVSAHGQKRYRDEDLMATGISQQRQPAASLYGGAVSDVDAAAAAAAAASGAYGVYGSKRRG